MKRRPVLDSLPYQLGVRYFVELCFFKHSINIDIYICISIYFYKHTYVHSIPINTSERLSQFNLEIHEIIYQ
jgi:hypothetical protein